MRLLLLLFFVLVVAWRPTKTNGTTIPANCSEAPWWPSDPALTSDESETRSDRLCTNFTQQFGCRSKNFCCWYGPLVGGFCLVSNELGIDCPEFVSEVECSGHRDLCWWDETYAYGPTCRRRCPATEDPTALCTSLGDTRVVPSWPTPLPTFAPIPTNLPTTFPTLNENITQVGTNSTSDSVVAAFYAPCSVDSDCPPSMVCFGGNSSDNATVTNNPIENALLGITGHCDCARTTFKMDPATGCTEIHPSLYVDAALVVIPGLVTLILSIIAFVDCCHLGCEKRLEFWGALTHAVFFLFFADVLYAIWRFVDLACDVNSVDFGPYESIIDPIAGKACSLVNAQVMVAVFAVITTMTSLLNWARATTEFLLPESESRPRADTLICACCCVITVVAVLFLPQYAFWIIVPVLILPCFVLLVVMFMAKRAVRVEKRRAKQIMHATASGTKNHLALTNNDQAPHLDKSRAKRIIHRMCAYIFLILISVGCGVASFVIIGPNLGWNYEGPTNAWDRPAFWLLRSAEFIFVFIPILITADIHGVAHPSIAPPSKSRPNTSSLA